MGATGVVMENDPVEILSNTETMPAASGLRTPALPSHTPSPIPPISHIADAKRFWRSKTQAAAPNGNFSESDQFFESLNAANNAPYHPHHTPTPPPMLQTPAPER